MLVQPATPHAPAADTSLVPGLALPVLDGLPGLRDAGITPERLGPPPAAGSAAERADHDAIRSTRALRTPQADAWASTMDLNGSRRLWYELLDRRIAPADAARGAALLTQVLDANRAKTSEIKLQHLRARPYDVIPGYDLPVRRPTDTSYPSGHTSASYAAARVISTLVPSAADEAYSLARQVAVSRVYGGVHFPSDVVAGAQLGTAIAAAMLRATPAHSAA